MRQQQGPSFTDLVGRSLRSEEARTLWTPVSEEFRRVDGGPDAVKVFLEAESQRLQGIVVEILESIDQTEIR